MLTLIPYLLALFCILVPLGWLVNLKLFNPLTQPMSGYLAPPAKLAYVTDLGYGCLAVALPLVAFRFGGLATAALGWLGALALVIVVLTKWWIHDSPGSASNAHLETLHTKAAAAAFLSAAAIILIHAPTGGLAFDITIAALAFDLLYSKYGSPKMLDAVEERVTTACYMIALFSLL